MRIYSYQELQNMLHPIDELELYRRICRNIKRIRLEKYKEFKRECRSNSINPYSTENFAALLEYNHTHYKRFESENDSTKRMPLKKIILATLILDTTLDEIIK